MRRAGDPAVTAGAPSFRSPPRFVRAERPEARPLQGRWRRGVFSEGSWEWQLAKEPCGRRDLLLRMGWPCSGAPRMDPRALWPDPLPQWVDLRSPAASGMGRQGGARGWRRSCGSGERQCGRNRTLVCVRWSGELGNLYYGFTNCTQVN